MSEELLSRTEAPEAEWERPMLFALELVNVVQFDDSFTFDGDGAS